MRSRLCAAFTLTAIVVAFVGSAVFLHVLHNGIASNLDSTLLARAQTISGALDGVAPPRLPDPFDNATTRGVAEDTAETFAVVILPSGRVVTATGAPAPKLTLPPVLKGVRSGQFVRATVLVGHQSYRVAALGVERPDGVWVALAGASRRSTDEALHDLRNSLFVTSPILVLLVAAGTWVIATAALRPVERMRRDAAAHAGTSSERLAVPPTGDEIARLAVTLNELLERLGASLTRQQDLVADAGHELRTPLAILRTELELASRPGRSHAELADAVEHAALEVERLSELAEDLLFLARADTSGPLVRPQLADLGGVLTAAARSARAAADAAGVNLVADFEPELEAEFDPAAIRRAVDNLLANAIEYAPNHPDDAQGRAEKAQVTLNATYRPGRRALTISVEDTGPGFPSDFLPHAFDRFRRADPARSHSHGQRGAGLGLAVVREIAEAHGGSAVARNLPGGGGCVVLTIPQPIPV